MSNTKTEQECGTKGLPLGITSHPEYRYWMRHWIVVDEEMIYGYAPDNECLAFGTDIDIFFSDYKRESKRWVDEQCYYVKGY